MRGINIYSIARCQAHKEGIKIMRKEFRDITGYRVSEGLNGFNVELMNFDDCSLTWTAYDMDFDYPTVSAARASARGQFIK